MSPLPWLGLRAFVEVGRRGAIKSAAPALGVTPGAISQQIKALERRLGTPLFERHHRLLRLTPEGARLLAEIDESFAAIEQAVARRSGTAHRSGIVTVSTTPSLASTWLAARLGRFTAAHPSVEVRLQTTAALADVRGGEADVAIRHGKGTYAGLVSERLFAPRLVLVASPALLRMAAPLRTAADCLSFPLLQDRDRRDWSVWFAAAGLRPDPRASAGSSFGDDALLIRAAIAGQGLAVVRDVYAADDLAGGRLVQPLATAAETSLAYHVVVAPDRLALPRVAAFRDWIRAEALQGAAGS
ncbi:LysR substrate-binding domain-containing protein [Kaistia geumhonensis]|uniref:LysR family glycine cleavage system transcriptional activator n=1 Tax=Kaistia geumhonensis TaxID=410839 RepID=A0ABU0M3W0_9HYPH|nr:LysR substrate-binding domain-containing protein [Kaistia geumhonensis]MCX5479154.1 LysR substrate-binding domain-containing protein [Kaistia geumhonensis]MDQ0515626.1 LysR family glycine cleavage system transcriptional activator [Kaistia geumhonensis]